MITLSEKLYEPSLLPRYALTWKAFSPFLCASGITLANCFSSGNMTFFPYTNRCSLIAFAVAVGPGSTPSLISLPVASTNVHTMGSGAVTPSGGGFTPSPFLGMRTKLCCFLAFSGIGRQNICSETLLNQHHDDNRYVERKPRSV